MRGVHAESYSDISPQTILPKFKETSLPLFFIHMYPAKLTGAATRRTRSVISMYLIFIMVVLYVGGRVVVEVDVIQHERVTRDRRGWRFLFHSPS